MPTRTPGGPRHRPPDASGALFERAIADHRAGRLEQAEAAYREILRKAPEHSRALQNLGVICRVTGRRDEALTLYRQALDRDPMLDAVRLNLGNLLNDLRRSGEAEREFRAILQRRAGDARALLGLGVALQGQLRDAEAAEILTRLVELAPEHRHGLRHLALVLGRLGRIAESAAIYERLLAIEPDDDPGLHLGLGRALTRLHDFPGGVRHLRRAAELAPDDTAPLVALGFAQLYAGDGEAALVTAREAARRRPSDPTGWFVLARVLLLQGDTAAAREALDRGRAVGIDPSLAADLEQVMEGRPTGAATPETLRKVYDDVASYYESHIRPALQNHVWQQLIELLDRELGPASRFTAAVDLGCGPGLMGETLRPRAGHLVGVDLSPAMLAMAAKRQIYDELVASDLLGFLQTTTASFDLAVASDVMQHVGDLPALLGTLARRIRPGGVALFSTEHSETADLVPAPDFRFRHSARHVGQAASSAGFTILAQEVAQIRAEHGAPVMGGLYLSRRPV